MRGVRRGLRGRVLLALVVAFIPLIALEAYLLEAQAAALRDRIVSERAALARSLAETSDTYVYGKIAALDALALTPVIRDPASGDLDGYLRSLLGRDPSWLTIGLSGADGLNISSLTTPRGTVNVSDRDYFQGALAGHATVGTALLTRSTGVKSLIVAVPVVAADGTRVVLSGALSLSFLEAQLRRSVPAGVDIIVVDGKGQQFIGPGVGETFPTVAESAAAGAALRGEDGAIVTRDRGVEELAGFADAPFSGWGIVLEQPTSAAFAEIDRQRATALALAGAATVVALGVAAYLGARLDITYTRERERLERVLAEMPVAVAIYDRRGRALIRNATYRSQIGGDRAPADLAETLRFYRSRAPDGRELTLADHPTARALRGETVRGEQVVLDHPDTGEPVHILVNALPFREGPEGSEIGGALVVFQDVTALTELERQRAAFFEMASHEIKTPLTALLGYVQLARRRALDGGERVAELLARAEAGGQRLADLVRDLLDTSRIDEGRLEVARERTDLAALVAAAVEDVSIGLERHEIAFRPPAEPFVVDADPRRLTQVLQNVLDNAVRYSPGGGRIEVTVAREDGQAVVRVADHGIGIPDDERALLFQRFYRTSRARPYGGTGLGLYISRRIAEMHGGRLWLERSGPQGSVFAFALPLAAPLASAV